MNLLLDSHVFVWWCDDHPRLSERTRAAIARPASTVAVSIVTAWELAIAQSRGRMALSEPFEQMLAQTTFSLLPVERPYRSRGRAAVSPSGSVRSHARRSSAP
jgi:PIN domain nuclease of toxin-antitoxin system